MTRDDFDYAIENTHVIVAPEQQIATFGTTSFDFYLISELMDRVDQVRIRNGKIHAERKSGAIHRAAPRARSEYRGASLWLSIPQNRSKRADPSRFN